MGLSLNYTMYSPSAPPPLTSERPRGLGAGEVVGTGLSPIGDSEVCLSVKHTGIFSNLHVGWDLGPSGWVSGLGTGLGLGAGLSIFPPKPAELETP